MNTQKRIAQVVEDVDGSNKRVIFHSYEALWNTPVWTYLYAAPVFPPSPTTADLWRERQSRLRSQNLTAAFEEGFRYAEEFYGIRPVEKATHEHD